MLQILGSRRLSGKARGGRILYVFNRRATKPGRMDRHQNVAVISGRTLRCLADCLEQGKRFRIQVDGERISIPPDAVINIEHEQEGSAEEVEFQLKWSI